MLPETEFTPEFFEKVIVKYLTVNSDVRERMIPYLMNKDDLKIFHNPNVRSVVSKITHLFEKYKEFPPPSTVKMELTTEEQQNVFESAIKLDISEFNETHLLGKIEEFYKQGRMFNILSDAVAKMQESSFDEMGDIASSMRETLSFTFDQETGLNLFSNNGIEKMYEHFHTAEDAIPTGIELYDNITKGGVHKKSLTIFAAESNLGKSAVLCALSANAVMSNHKVLYITLEMNELMIGERIVANLFDVAINDIKKIPKETFHSKYSGILNKFKDNLIIKEFPARSMNANTILTLLKDLELKNQFVPDVIYLDYLGLCVPIRLRKEENTYSEQKRVSEEIRAVAMEMNLPIVTAYQVNRSGFGSASVGMTAISDSIGVIFSADMVCILTQTPEQKEAKIMSWYIAKSRYGDKDLRFDVGMDIPKMKLYNLSGSSVSSSNGELTQDSPDIDSQLQSFLSSRRKTI